MAERGWWKHANERKAAERNVEKGGGRTKNPVAPTAESLFLWIFEHAPINSNVHDERVARREVVVRLPSIGSPVGLAGFLPKGWMCTRYPRDRGSGARVRPSSSKVKRGRYGCGCRTSRNHRKPVAQPLPDPPLCVADSRAPWPTQSNDSSTPLVKYWNVRPGSGDCSGYSISNLCPNPNTCMNDKTKGFRGGLSKGFLDRL